MNAHTKDVIDCHIVNNEFVSYRWLSNELNIPVSTSKSLLEEYKAEHPHGVLAMYCICGKRKVNSASKSPSIPSTFSILIVAETELETTKGEFEVVTSCQVFSLQRIKTSSTISQLCNVDTEQAKDLLMLQPANKSYLLNHTSGGVCLPTATVKEVGQRQISASQAIEFREKVKETSQQQSERLLAMMDSKKSAAKAINASKVASFFDPKSSTNSTSSSVAASSSSSTTSSSSSAAAAAASFFGKKESKKPSPSPSGDAVANKVQATGEEDEMEWEEDGEKTKTSKETLKKRRAEESIVPRSVAKADAEADTEAMEGGVVGDDGDDDDAADGSAGKSKKQKFKPVIRGPMDDVMEDIAIAKELAAQKAAASGGTGEVVKKTKKKLVERMYETEDGFMETRYEMEEVTDDEADKPPVRAASPTGGNSGATSAPKPKVESKAPPPKKTGKAAAADAKPQKSMMSFFAKK